MGSFFLTLLPHESVPVTVALHFLNVLLTKFCFTHLLRVSSPSSSSSLHISLLVSILRLLNDQSTGQNIRRIFRKSRKMRVIIRNEASDDPF